MVPTSSVKTALRKGFAAGESSLEKEVTFEQKESSKILLTAIPSLSQHTTRSSFSSAIPMKSSEKTSLTPSK